MGRNALGAKQLAPRLSKAELSPPDGDAAPYRNAGVIDKQGAIAATFSDGQNNNVVPNDGAMPNDVRRAKGEAQEASDTAELNAAKKADGMPDFNAGPATGWKEVWQ